MVTHERRPILGVPTCRGISLTDAGRIVHRCWIAVADRIDDVLVDEFIVMSDHVHAIVVLQDARDRTVGLSDVVGVVKQRAASEIAALTGGPQPPIWQRSFHDRIIRDAAARECIRGYIVANPSSAWNVIQNSRDRKP